MGALGIGLLLVASACGDAKPVARLPTPATARSTTSTTAPPDLLASDQSGCVGIGGARPAAQLTWIQRNELRSADGCIVRFVADYGNIQPAWDRTGRWLALDGPTSDTWVVDANGARLVGQPSAWSWIGTAGDLLVSTEAGWTVHHADGTQTTVPGTDRIGVMGLSVESDGRHVVGIATIGGTEGLYRVDVSDGSAVLLRKASEPDSFESAQVIAGDDVVFSETIGDQAFFRRLARATGEVTTLAKSTKFFGASGVGSPFDSTALAWTTDGGGCGGPPRTEGTLHGKPLPLAGTAVGEAPPDSWMPDGTLLLLDRGESCDYSSGTLWSFKNGRAAKIADDVLDVAVRTTG